jgi:hypothetical protein
MPYNHISYRDRGKERKVSDLLAQADSLWNYGERALGKWDDKLWPAIKGLWSEPGGPSKGAADMGAAGEAEAGQRALEEAREAEAAEKSGYNASLAEGMANFESSRRGESTGGEAAHEAWRKAKAKAENPELYVADEIEESENAEHDGGMDWKSLYKRNRR